jgi:hypothetical protein
MLDVYRVFRMLLHLHREENDFLLAQDAFVTLRSCLNQLDAIVSEIDRYGAMNKEHHRIGRFNATIAALEILRSILPDICGPLTVLMELSESFWLCAPVDRTSTTSISALRRWQIYQNGCIKDEVLRLQILDFRRRCLDLMKNLFPDLMEELIAEERNQIGMTSDIRQKPFRFANKLPYGVVQDIRNSILVYFASVSRDHPHFCSVDPRFAYLLGFTVARMIMENRSCFHMLPPTNFIKSMLSGVLNQEETAPIVFYRTSYDTAVVIQWQFSSTSQDEILAGFGMNMTRDVDLFKAKQVQNKQRVLRQWLHSIRNASFEQQAADILEALTLMEKDIPTGDFSSEFASLYDSIKLLISSAGSTVDLIDQALDSRGQLQSSPFSHIVAKATRYPEEFAQSNNYGPIMTKAFLTFNSNPISGADFPEFIISYQIDNLMRLLEGLLENGIRLVSIFCIQF